jgi:hypothetical protein
MALAYSMLRFTAQRGGDATIQAKAESPVKLRCLKPLLAALATAPGISEYILTDHRGRPCENADTLSHAIRRQLTACGCIGLAMHGLRATAPSELTKNRAGVKGIRSVRDHNTPHMALYYYSLADQGRINENTVEIWDDAIKRTAAAKSKTRPQGILQFAVYGNEARNL